MQQEKSFGAAVFHKKGKEILYLLLHYPGLSGKDFWDMPKGQSEGQETPEQAMRRELKEETGITKFDLVQGFSEKITYFFKQNNELIKKEVTLFLVSSHKLKVKTSEEHLGYEWCTIEEAKKKMKFKNSRDVLLKAHEHLSHPIELQKTFS